MVTWQYGNIMGISWEYKWNINRNINRKSHDIHTHIYIYTYSHDVPMIIMERTKKSIDSY